MHAAGHGARTNRSLREGLPVGGGSGHAEWCRGHKGRRRVLVPVGSSPRPQDRLRSCMSHARPNGPGHADWRQG